MAGADFIDCVFHGIGGTAIDAEGAGDCTFTNCSMVGSVDLNSSQGNVFRNSNIYSKSKLELPFNMGLNKSCFCGSGKKFKRCHGSEKRVATGIKSYNSDATFEGTKIVTDGVGIDLDSDRSKFNDTVIIAGSEIDYVALAKGWGIPDSVPIDHVKEAVEDVKRTKNPGVLDKSRLKVFLANNGFDMACWAQIALSIVTYCFAPS
ncbi:SEC-C domain-containing protein [Pseudomonas putida]|jgi:hypothetical protein|uniref:SEC-C metal-binding domain-containing protein n=1 Tax=Pseudomonas putida TaxID=303 RepID=UPI001F18577D|nr:SEC-C metal-binding domain-containing protein [Pseudomonas putida]MCF1250320.1 SEC-C domain-containing protein [Pseudomonas putida]